MKEGRLAIKCRTILEKCKRPHRVESSLQFILSGLFVMVFLDAVVIFTLRTAGNDYSYLLISYPTINVVFH